MRTTLFAAVGLALTLAGCQNPHTPSKVYGPMGPGPNHMEPMQPPTEQRPVVTDVEPRYLTDEPDRPTRTRLVRPVRTRYDEPRRVDVRATDTARDEPLPPSGVVTHTIQRGDTLWTLSKRYLGSGKRYREILAANPGLQPKKLRIGQTIVIPAAD
ncbi:MAG: LysM peptidoglycan-binding domain-containing protein [Planctomycetota bacterium]